MTENKYCNFYQLEAGKVRCVSCGQVIATKSKPENCHAICSMPSEDCLPAAFPEENRKLQCEWQEVVGQPRQADSMIYHHCIHCGYVERFQQNTSLYRECSSPRSGRNAVQMPPFLERMVNFAESLAHHISIGSPVSTEAEILESFRVCSPCKYYNDLVGACGQCGCFINLYKHTENLNALAWADKCCPIDKWKSPLERRVNLENSGR